MMVASAQSSVENVSNDPLVQPCSLEAVYSSRANAVAKMMNTFSKPFIESGFFAAKNQLTLLSANGFMNVTYSTNRARTLSVVARS